MFAICAVRRYPVFGTLESNQLIGIISIVTEKEKSKENRVSKFRGIQ